MPLYDYKNKQTGEIAEYFIKYSEKKKFEEDHPELEYVFISQMSIGDPIKLGKKQLPDDFKKALRKIKKENPGSNMSIP